MSAVDASFRVEVLGGATQPTPPDVLKNAKGKSLCYQWVIGTEVVCLTSGSEGHAIDVYSEGGVLFNHISLGKLSEVALSAIKANSIPRMHAGCDVDFLALDGAGGVGTRATPPVKFAGGSISLLLEPQPDGATSKWFGLVECPDLKTSWKVASEALRFFQPNIYYEARQICERTARYGHRRSADEIEGTCLGLSYWSRQPRQGLLPSEYTPVDLLIWEGKVELISLALYQLHVRSKVSMERWSFFDPTITKSRSAITLTDNDPRHKHGHACILVERIGDDGYQMWKAGLVGGKRVLHVTNGRVCMSRVADPETYVRERIVSRSRTWLRSAVNVDAWMASIRRVLEEQSNGEVSCHFFPTGASSVLGQYFGGRQTLPVHNCTSWAREQLLELGISLPASMMDAVITLPSEHARQR